MRVLLSGTSNSVLAKGFSSGIQAHPEVQSFHNASYGASSTIAIGDHLRNLDFSAYDFCVIEYCVNEEVLVSSGKTQLEDGLSNISAICDAASRAGCRPVLAIFSNITRLQTPRPFETGIYDWFVAQGAPAFNVYPLIDRLTADLGWTAEDVFMDPLHIRRDAAFFVGQALMDVLAERQAAPAKLTETDRVYAPIEFLPHDRISFSGERRKVARETRLLKAEFTHLAPGGAILLDKAAAETELAGMTGNAARSWGKLRDPRSGEPIIEPRAKNLFTLTRELLLVSWPCTPPIPPQEEAYSLAYDYEAPLKAPEDTPPPGLEISGLILRDRRRLRPLAILTDGGETALETQIPQTRYECALTQLKEAGPLKSAQSGASAE